MPAYYPGYPGENTDALTNKYVIFARLIYANGSEGYLTALHSSNSWETANELLKQVQSNPNLTSARIVTR